MVSDYLPEFLQEFNEVTQSAWHMDSIQPMLTFLTFSFSVISLHEEPSVIKLLMCIFLLTFWVYWNIFDLVHPKASVSLRSIYCLKQKECEWEEYSGNIYCLTYIVWLCSKTKTGKSTMIVSLYCCNRGCVTYKKTKIVSSQ